MTSSVAPLPAQGDPVWSFGDRLRKARSVHGATQRDFADALDVKHPTYAAWESDRTSCPRETAIAKRIEVLTGVRAVWLLGLDEPAPPPRGDGSPSVDGGSTTHRYVGRNRHLVAVDDLLGASPTTTDDLEDGPAGEPAAARIGGEDATPDEPSSAPSPFAPGRSFGPLSIAVPA